MTVLYNRTHAAHPVLGSGASPPAAVWSAWAVGPASAFCARSGKTSPKRLGRNRSRRLQVSSHRRLFPPPSSGGSRKPPFTITRRIFFKLSGTASSYIHRQRTTSRDHERGMRGLMRRRPLTRLSPCPLFINRSIMSRIRSHRSSMPSHSESRTR